MFMFAPACVQALNDASDKLVATIEPAEKKTRRSPAAKTGPAEASPPASAEVWRCVLVVFWVVLWVGSLVVLDFGALFRACVSEDNVDVSSRQPPPYRFVLGFV